MSSTRRYSRFALDLPETVRDSNKNTITVILERCIKTGKVEELDDLFDDDSWGSSMCSSDEVVSAAGSGEETAAGSSEGGQQ